MGFRLSKIYTRKGDDGTTSLDGKNRLPKNALRLEVIGTIDELNCAIGLVLSHDTYSDDVRSFLQQVQQNLFNVGGELCPPFRQFISAEQVLFLENKIDKWNEDLPPLKEFILPGGDAASAACHLARAICRRAERSLVALHHEEPMNKDLLHFINRLSDALFVAARVLTKEVHGEEILWQHERK